nr:unnamed protein product [Digitaria exilis]
MNGTERKANLTGNPSASFRSPVAEVNEELASGKILRNSSVFASAGGCGAAGSPGFGKIEAKQYGPNNE